MPKNKLPVLPDIATFKQIFAHLLPKGASGENFPLQASILSSLQVMDRQDAVRKGQYYGAPYGMDSALAERIAYSRYRFALVYEESLDEFFTLPFVGIGLTARGRYKKLRVLPFCGSKEDEDSMRELPIFKKEFNAVYDPIPPEKLTIDDIRDSAVVFFDYTPEFSNSGTPRVELQAPLLYTMSEIICFARTALAIGTGVQGIRTEHSDEATEVANGAKAIISAAISGQYAIPITAGINAETLTKGAPTKVEDYLLYLQSLDNLRLSMHGLDNGGLFEKKAHMLESEQSANAGVAGMVLQDATLCRQHACTVANSIWGLGMWWMPTEPAVGGDMDGNGQVLSNEPEQNGGEME